MADYAGTHTYGIISTYSPSSEELTRALERTNHVYKNEYSAGTGPFQCDSFISDDHTGTTQNYDLDSTLNDKYGTILSFTKIKALCIINKQAATGEDITVEGDFITSVFGASTAIVLGPGGMLVLENPIDGYTVTATTGDVLTITKASSKRHQIFIAGLD